MFWLGWPIPPRRAVGTTSGGVEMGSFPGKKFFVTRWGGDSDWLGCCGSVDFLALRLLAAICFLLVGIVRSFIEASAAAFCSDVVGFLCGGEHTPPFGRPSQEGMKKKSVTHVPGLNCYLSVGFIPLTAPTSDSSEVVGIPASLEKPDPRISANFGLLTRCSPHHRLWSQGCLACGVWFQSVQAMGCRHRSQPPSP